MSEQSPEPTTATDLEGGAAKPGADYGDNGAGAGDAAGNGAAVPDEPGAEAAQEGVQEAFEVAPQE